MSRLSTKQRRARRWRRLLVRYTDVDGNVPMLSLLQAGIDHCEFLRRGYHESVSAYWLVRGPPPRRIRWHGVLVCEHPSYQGRMVQQGLAAWLPSTVSNVDAAPPPINVEQVLRDAWELLKREHDGA
jgi:hypothetical protein